MPQYSWKNYLFAFLITVILFGSIFALSNYLNNRKVAELKSIQDNISLDILSSETEFSLLSELACNQVDNPVLSGELNSYADKITYSEQNLGSSAELTQLKEFYALLEIKDYLLVKQIDERCGAKTTSILYFYTTSDNCSECTKQGYVLTALREEFPNLRVYSFDYSTDLSAVRALISIFKIQDTALPALVINDKLYTGFKSIDDIEGIVPDLVKENEQAATSTSGSSSSATINTTSTL